MWRIKEYLDNQSPILLNLFFFSEDRTQLQQHAEVRNIVFSLPKLILQETSQNTILKMRCTTVSIEHSPVTSMTSELERKVLAARGDRWPPDSHREGLLCGSTTCQVIKEERGIRPGRNLFRKARSCPVDESDSTPFPEPGAAWFYEGDILRALGYDA